MDVFFDQRLDVPDTGEEPKAPEGAGRSVFMTRTGAGAGGARRSGQESTPFHVKQPDGQDTIPGTEDQEPLGAVPTSRHDETFRQEGASQQGEALRQGEAPQEGGARQEGEAPAEVDPEPETGSGPARHDGDGQPSAPVAGPDAPVRGSLPHEVTTPGAQAPEDGTPGVEDPVDDDPDGLVPVPGARFLELPVTSIVPNARQPRTVFDEEELQELVQSVRTVGVLQPVVVRPLPGAEEGGDGSAPAYELVMGERRWRAATEAGLGVVPAIVRDTTDDDLLRDALLENLHRSQLNPLEEAAAYAQLLEDFGCTHEELAGRIGRSRPQISNTLRLLRLPPLVQRRVAAGVLSAGHARALLALEDGAAMERLAQRVVAEGLSVRAVEEIITLGGGVGPSRGSRPPAAPRPELESRAAALADRLDTRVKITMGRAKGRLTVDFAGIDDLDRILAVLAGGSGSTGGAADSN